MLYIIEGSAISLSASMSHVGWHIGQSLPQLKSRVITFQADGNELDVILTALRGKPAMSLDEMNGITSGYPSNPDLRDKMLGSIGFSGFCRELEA